MMNLTIENITENVNTINSTCDDRRLKYILSRLVTHIHELVRETRVSTDEWMAAIQFLTAVGKKCTGTRQEFILLSDVLGISLLVDAIDHPKPAGATEGTVLGPFHTDEAHDAPHGSAIASDPDGEELLCLCTVKDLAGKPLEGVKVDVWETDSKGFYDVQYSERDGPDGRAVLVSDKEGDVWYKAIVPVPYPIPGDGPVGDLLKKLGRHYYRPGHMHFMLSHPDYDPLITALYLKGDPYESSDAVFGVKNTLIVQLGKVEDEETATKYGVKIGCALLKYDFVLVTKEDALELKHSNAKAAMESQGIKMEYIDGLPVPEVD